MFYEFWKIEYIILRLFLNYYSRLYVHHTCATDTDQMEYVFDATADIILQSVLNEIGLM